MPEFLEYLEAASSAWDDGQLIVAHWANSILDDRAIPLRVDCAAGQLPDCAADRLAEAYERLIEKLRPLAPLCEFPKRTYLRDVEGPPVEFNVPASADDVRPWKLGDCEVPKLSGGGIAYWLEKEIESLRLIEWSPRGWESNFVRPMRMHQASWQTWFDQQRPALRGTPLVPGFLGLIPDDSARVVRRHGVDAPADFTKNRTAWLVFRVLYKRGSAHCDQCELMDLAWEGAVVTKSAVEKQVGFVKRQLEPLGVVVKNDRSMGYRLELPASG